MLRHHRIDHVKHNMNPVSRFIRLGGSSMLSLNAPYMAHWDYVVLFRRCLCGWI
ncbi:hypothetical protein CPC08DRAFT_195913 [Agrocybe pediades]|nr:hypothetical protein CPC08DRAFT_195913 [Agrocybe pediades]